MTLNLLEPQISPMLNKSLEQVISKALSRKKLFNYLSYMSNPQRVLSHYSHPLTFLRKVNGSLYFEKDSEA